MPEKISDIYFPKTSPDFESKNEFPRIVKKTPRQKVPKQKSPKRNFLPLFFGAIVILAIVVFAVFSLSQAQINIWPETKILSFQERIEVNTRAQSPDFEGKVFPGKAFEIALEESQTFSATGKTLQGTKAKGAIQIYNAYSTDPQVLVANTRFISSEGKLFRSLKRVVIPGGKYDAKGKLVPGALDIEVAAAQAGEEYNIGPSTFSIPGFAGTVKYTVFYGKSFSAMSGGFQGEAPQVKEEDLRQAEETLSRKILEKGESELKKKLPPDIILIQDAYKIEVKEFIPGAKAGDAVLNFNSQIKGSLKAIAFKQSDLENFAQNLILEKVPQDDNFFLESFWTEIKVQDSSFKLDYKIYSIDFEKGIMALDSESSAKVYPSFEQALFKKAFVGRSLEEAEIMLSSQPQIKKAEVGLKPFWVQKIPQDLDKIKIKINID